MRVTISTHNGSSVARQHNIRNRNVTSKESHIDISGKYEIWYDESPRAAYERIFGQAVERYNEQQQRSDRRIKSYYNDVCNDAKKHPVYEMIIGIYGSDDPVTCKYIMREFVNGWQERNPNLELIGAYYHADEQGEPHVHIDYIPVAHGYKRGPVIQTGLVKALGEQGFVKHGKATAQIRWEARENAHLDRLCRDRGIDVHHPVIKAHKHLDTQSYKAAAELNQYRTLQASEEYYDITTSKMPFGNILVNKDVFEEIKAQALAYDVKQRAIDKRLLLSEFKQNEYAIQVNELISQLNDTRIALANIVRAVNEIEYVTDCDLMDDLNESQQLLVRAIANYASQYLDGKVLHEHVISPEIEQIEQQMHHSQTEIKQAMQRYSQCEPELPDDKSIINLGHKNKIRR